MLNIKNIWIYKAHWEDHKNIKMCAYYSALYLSVLPS